MKIHEVATEPYMFVPEPANSRSYMGNILSVVVPAAKAHDRLFIVETRTLPGSEPPPHLHEWQDEVIFILEGDARIFCGEHIFDVGPNAYVFVPKGTAHAFKFRSAVRLIGLGVTTDARTGATDEYFMTMSQPTTSMTPSTLAATYGAEDHDGLNRFFELGAKYGARFLTPDEARDMMPKYPGFGVSPE